MHQLNERLGQFIARARLIASTTPTCAWPAVWRPVQPGAHPGVGEVLRITQQELALPGGLSRQRVNESADGVAGAKAPFVREYGGVRVLGSGGVAVQRVCPQGLCH